MKIITKPFLCWLMGLTTWTRYLVIALIVHGSLLFGLATIKVIIPLATIIAAFTGDAPPPPTKIIDDIDPYAGIRNFDYVGPALGRGASFGAGATPAEYKPHVFSGDSATDKTLGEVIGPLVGNFALVVASLPNDPGGLIAPTTEVGNDWSGPKGVYRKDKTNIFITRGDIATPTRPTPGGTSMEAEKSVHAALRWLKNNQNLDGSWEKQHAPAITGLATLAFLGHGHNADDKEFGPTIIKAFEYLCARIPQSNLYAHAIVTYALAEGYGMTQSPALKEPLQRCVDVLVQSQQVKKENPLHIGGWRYSLGSTDADTSVTGWCVQALEAAKLAGASVPESALESASRYLWNMYGGGSFGYSEPGDAFRPSTTAIGVLCQAFLGQSGDPRIKQALDKLKEEKFEWDKDKGWTTYVWYYLTQAFFQGGGSYWERWNNNFRDALIRKQSQDGHWDLPPQSKETYGLAYSTSLCCLMLEVYYRYLPTYQSIEQKQLEKRPGLTTPKLETKATN
jgi:hypothetical protein